MKQASFFRSSGFLNKSIIQTESGGLLDLTELPAFLRTLLVTDGTVTKALEAWFWESVKVRPVSNYLEIMQSPVAGLEAKIGDRVLQREVTLNGQSSKNIFAVARSSVSLKHLPKEVAQALEKGEIGIGELLREKGVETYRDIFNIDYFSVTPQGDPLLSKLSGSVLSRSYRIRVNGSPAIIVCESFPLEIYQN